MYQGMLFQNAAVHLGSCLVTRTYWINGVDVGFEVLTWWIWTFLSSGTYGVISQDIKTRILKTYGEWRHSSTVLDLCSRWNWVVSFALLPLYPRGNGPATHYIGGRANTRASLNFMMQRKISYLSWKSNSDWSDVRPYTWSLCWLNWVLCRCCMLYHIRKRLVVLGMEIVSLFIVLQLH